MDKESDRDIIKEDVLKIKRVIQSDAERDARMKERDEERVKRKCQKQTQEVRTFHPVQLMDVILPLLTTTCCNSCCHFPLH